MESKKNIVTIVLLVSLIALLGCFAPSQVFVPGGETWVSANPEYSAIESVEKHNANHKTLVGVLDAGVDYNLPRLQKNLHAFPIQPVGDRSYGLGWDVLGNDFFPFYKVIRAHSGVDMSDFLEVAEHGTHVTQLVALNDPNIGILPIRIYPVEIKIQDWDSIDQGRDYWQMVLYDRSLDAIETGIDFALDKGASIINLSVGLEFDGVSNENRQILLDKMNQSFIPKLEKKWTELLFIASAGNEGMILDSTTKSIPATLDAPNVLSVGALKDSRNIAAYSNFGRYVDVYVRGTDISSAIPKAIDVDCWGKLSGTSMSAPLVAHLAAQLKIIDPSLSAQQLRALIVNTADEKELDLEVFTRKKKDRPKKTVRVLNMNKARRTAKRFLNHTEERVKWLTPIYNHGNSPH